MINGPPSFKYHDGFGRFVILCPRLIFECIVKKELFYKIDAFA